MIFNDAAGQDSEVPQGRLLPYSSKDSSLCGSEM
jgi:hypothetical protein